MSDLRLLADPTELRFGSRLPEVLRSVAEPCEGLEERTGADLLVTPLSLPHATSGLLRRHAESGLLVQRKTGPDFFASVQDGRLSDALRRMLSWTNRPWLAVVGELKEWQDMAVIDGRPGLMWSSFAGALDWWQMRGGYYTFMPTDDAFIHWLHGWPDRLSVLAAHPEKAIIRSPAQTLIVDPGLNFLAAIPGLGETRAQALLDAADHDLARALAILTSDTGPSVPGIGPGTKKKARAFLSLDDDRFLAAVDQSELFAILPRLLEEVEDGAETLAYLYATVAKWAEIPCSAGSWDDWRAELVGI